MRKPSTVITPIALFLETSAAAGFFFVPACFVRANLITASITTGGWRRVSALAFGAPMLKTGAIVAPVALFVCAPVASRPLFQVQRVLGIDDRVERPDDLVHVLC